MKKYLRFALLPLVMLSMAPSQVAQANEVENNFSQPYATVEWTIPVTVKKTYAPGVSAPGKIYVERVVGGFRYSGYIYQVDVLFYNTGRRDVTYSGTLHLN